MLKNKVFLIVNLGIWVLLLTVPQEWLHLTMSLRLPIGGRLSIVDLYYMFLCSTILWGGTKDKYVKHAVWSLLGVAYVLATWGFCTAALRGVDLRSMGLDFRWFLGFGAGLGFARHAYLLSPREKACIFSLFGGLLLGISVWLHIHGATDLIRAIGRGPAIGSTTVRVIDVRAFSLFAVSIFFTVRVTLLVLYAKGAAILVPIFLLLQAVIFMLTGIRNLAVLTVGAWILAIYAAPRRGPLICNLYALSLLVVLILVLGGINLEGRDLAGFDSFLRSTTTRVEEMSGLESISGDPRAFEIRNLLGELRAGDYLFGRGLGGTVTDYLGFGTFGYVRDLHVGIAMWLWKFGIVGCAVFLLGLYYTVRTFFMRCHAERPDSALWTAKSSSAAVLSWILLTCMSGGICPWFFLLIAVFAVDIHSYWLMRRGMCPRRASLVPCSYKQAAFAGKMATAAERQD